MKTVLALLSKLDLTEVFRDKGKTHGSGQLKEPSGV